MVVGSGERVGRGQLVQVRLIHRHQVRAVPVVGPSVHGVHNAIGERLSALHKHHRAAPADARCRDRRRVYGSAKRQHRVASLVHHGSQSIARIRTRKRLQRRDSVIQAVEVVLQPRHVADRVRVVLCRCVRDPVAAKGCRFPRHTTPWHLCGLSCRVFHISRGARQLALVHHDIHPSRRLHLHRVAELHLCRRELESCRVVSNLYQALQRALRDVRDVDHALDAARQTLARHDRAVLDLLRVILQAVLIQILSHNYSFLCVNVMLLSMSLQLMRVAHHRSP